MILQWKTVDKQQVCRLASNKEWQMWTFQLDLNEVMVGKGGKI